MVVEDLIRLMQPGKIHTRNRSHIFLKDEGLAVGAKLVNNLPQRFLAKQGQSAKPRKSK